MNVLHRFEDKDGTVFELWESVWRHIREGHPEMQDPDDLARALAAPDVIVRSNWSNTARLYYQRRGRHYRAVVVDTEEQRIKTAYTTDAIKAGETLWRRANN